MGRERGGLLAGRHAATGEVGGVVIQEGYVNKGGRHARGGIANLVKGVKILVNIDQYAGVMREAVGAGDTTTGGEGG